MSGTIRRLELAGPADVAPDVEGFLRALGGAAWLRVPGRDRSRARMVATLLHGNEPSGVRAVHAWLQTAVRPAVDAHFFLGAVEAALAPPGFAYRSLPGRADLNRCFRAPFRGAEGAVAREALALLDAAGPEAVVDLHNNTGHNPPYGVTPVLDVAARRLVGLFAERLVHSRLRLGALTEAARERCPSVTVECGRVGDPAADAVAHRGLARFLEAERLELERDPAQALQILADPVRVRARDGVRLAFADRPAAGADLTVRQDIDRHNFERLGPGAPIGWAERNTWPLEANDEAGRDVSRELFGWIDGMLRTRRDLIPIMMTTDPSAALQDCLFYVVRELEEAEPGPVDG